MPLPCPLCLWNEIPKLGEEHMVMTVVDEEKREHHYVVAVLKGESREPKYRTNEQQRAECASNIEPIETARATCIKV